jgi:hypothetical protein
VGNDRSSNRKARQGSRVDSMKIGPITLEWGRKESAAASLRVMSPGQPAWTGRDFKAFAVEGYQINAVANMAIDRIADAISQVPWEVWRDDRQIEGNDPLLNLWKRPNPSQSRSAFLEAVVGFYMISGNAYIEKVTGNREPRELWVLPSDRIKVVPGSDGGVQAYEYNNRFLWPVTDRSRSAVNQSEQRDNGAHSIAVAKPSHATRRVKAAAGRNVQRRRTPARACHA